MINPLTVEQVGMIKEHCSRCQECIIHTMFTYSYQYCKKHHTDSLIFLAERCEELGKMIQQVDREVLIYPVKVKM